MDEIGASFVVRLQDQSVIEEIERIPVSEVDRQRAITHHQRIALGHRNAQDNGWRLARPGQADRGHRPRLQDHASRDA
jgi:hypothetical protein